MTEKQEIEDQILQCEIELKDKVKMKLTEDKKMSHSSMWRTNHELADGLTKSHGKIYSLLLGQCTLVLIDKMKQHTNWGTFSDSFDPITFFKLIEKFVLKQLDNQYKKAVLIAKQLSILQFCQDDQVSNATYYDHFAMRVEVAHQAGVCHHTPDLLAIKAMELSFADFDTLTEPEQKRIIGLVEQDYLTYLFLHNSNANMHSQLKKDVVANAYTKCNPEAYPADIRKALTLMNEYKLSESHRTCM
jgi:hypothetical protein